MLLLINRGEDHNITRALVQASFIATFIKLDLDFLCAVRTSPTQSWTNLSKRVMSILDIALQRFSLERDNDREPRRYCQEMQQYENLRTKADEDPELKAAFISSLKSVFSLVESPFESMLLKENGVICSKA